MSRDSEQDIIALKEWMSKEPHLPHDLDALLLNFLHSCHYSLEQTKQCIDRFCSSRAQMPEVYNSRDPLSPSMQNIFDKTLAAWNPFNENEYILYKYDDPTLETFRFYELLKCLSMQADNWVRSRPALVEGHYIIIDMAHFSLKMIPRVNIMYLKDFILYLLEAMPVRVKKIICVNAPPFYETLYAFVKPILPVDIQNIMYFFPDHEGLYQFIDRKFLPKEYGGDAPSMYDQNQERRKNIEQERDFYVNDNSWRADIKKKSKTSDNAMSGSFRTLSID